VQTVTLPQLELYVWDRLPSVRRTLAGKRLVGRIVRRAVAGWPVPVLQQCDESESNVVGKYMAISIERQIRPEVGMGIVLMFVLSALIQEAVKILIRWWMENHANQDDMMALTREIRHHD
jgi:hypothetical protein